MAIPTLETSRLRLRAWRPGDVEAYARITANPEVMRYIVLPTPETSEQTIDRLRGHWDRHGFGQWAVQHKTDGTLIGRIGLQHHADWDRDPDNVEIGWLLDRSHWGQGLASEGARAALDWGFGELEVPRVISITQPANRASRRVMDKLGLRLQGKATWRSQSVVWYAISATGWLDARDGRASSPRCA